MERTLSSVGNRQRSESSMTLEEEEEEEESEQGVILEMKTTEVWFECEPFLT